MVGIPSLSTINVPPGAPPGIPPGKGPPSTAPPIPPPSPLVPVPSLGTEFAFVPSSATAWSSSALEVLSASERPRPDCTIVGAAPPSASLRLLVSALESSFEDVDEASAGAADSTVTASTGSVEPERGSPLPANTAVPVGSVGSSLLDPPSSSSFETDNVVGLCGL